MGVYREMLRLNLTLNTEIRTKGYIEFGPVLSKDVAITETDMSGKSMVEEAFAFVMSGNSMRRLEIGLWRMDITTIFQ